MDKLVQTYIEEGAAAGEAGDLNQAIKKFGEAIALDTNNDMAYHNRGFAYEQMGNFEQAIEDYSQVIALRPTVRAYYERGLCYGISGQEQQAIEDFNHIISLESDHTLAYANRAVAHRSVGNLEQALKDLDKAIELKPEDDAFYHDRGLTCAQLNKLSQAIEDIDKAIELNPQNADYYCSKGFVFSFFGIPEPAIENFEIYLDREPQALNRQEVLQEISQMRALIPLQNSQDVITALTSFAQAQCGSDYRPHIEIESLFSIGPEDSGPQEMVQWFMSDQPGLVFMLMLKWPMGNAFVVYGPQPPDKQAYLLGLNLGVSQTIPATVQALTDLLKYYIEQGVLTWSGNHWQYQHSSTN